MSENPIQIDEPGVIEVDPEEASDLALQEAGNAQSDDELLNTVSFTAIRAHDFTMLDIDATVWAWEGILPRGGISLLVGDAKDGKSTFLRSLHMAVSRGTPFLNRNTKAGGVLSFAHEDMQYELMAAYMRLGVTPDDPLWVHHGPLVPLHEREEQFKKLWPDGHPSEKSNDALIIELGMFCHLNKISVVTIDTLSQWGRTPEINDYIAIYDTMQQFRDFARRLNVHILFAHHVNKDPKKTDGARVLGSTALFGAVDTLLMLRKFKNQRSISSFQRYGERLEAVTLNMDPQTNLIHAGATVSAVATNARQDEIRSIFEKHPGQSLTEATICKHSKLGHRAVRIAILDGVKNGTLIRSGKGVSCHPYEYTPASAPTQEAES